MHQYRVHHAFYIGDKAPRRNQRWVYAQLNTLWRAPRDSEQLDAIAKLFRIANIRRCQLRDAFRIRLAQPHRNSERDGRDNRKLVGGIHAFDVESRISFGVAQTLRFLQDTVEARAFRPHLGEDEIAGAVDDAGDPFDSVAGQPLRAAS